MPIANGQTFASLAGFRLVPSPGTRDNKLSPLMLQGEDVVLLLKLSDSAPGWTVRTLAEETGIPRSVVHRALKRLATAGSWTSGTAG
jgi:hypothetical protein